MELQKLHEEFVSGEDLLCLTKMRPSGLISYTALEVLSMNFYRVLIVAVMLFPFTGTAQNTLGTASASMVPTTKILAIGHVAAPLTAEQRKSILPKEVPDTVRLY